MELVLNTHVQTTRDLHFAEQPRWGRFTSRRKIRELAEFCSAEEYAVAHGRALGSPTAAAQPASARSRRLPCRRWPLTYFLFGGAKNGMMYGEAVVFFKQKPGKGFQIHTQNKARAFAIENALHLGAI